MGFATAAELRAAVKADVELASLFQVRLLVRKGGAGVQFNIAHLL